jgi:hypothetical protein
MLANLSPAARRGLRTVYQAVIALLTVVPAFLAALPTDSPIAVKGAGIAVSLGAVSGLINKLEDSGLLPALLKADPEPAGK